MLWQLSQFPSELSSPGNMWLIPSDGFLDDMFPDASLFSFLVSRSILTHQCNLNGMSVFSCRIYYNEAFAILCSDTEMKRNISKDLVIFQDKNQPSTSIFKSFNGFPIMSKSLENPDWYDCSFLIWCHLSWASLCGLPIHPPVLSFLRFSLSQSESPWKIYSQVPTSAKLHQAWLIKDSDEIWRVGGYYHKPSPTSEHVSCSSCGSSSHQEAITMM